MSCVIAPEVLAADERCGAATAPKSWQQKSVCEANTRRAPNNSINKTILHGSNGSSEDQEGFQDVQNTTTFCIRITSAATTKVTMTTMTTTDGVILLMMNGGNATTEPM